MFEETVQPEKPVNDGGGSQTNPQNDEGASDNGGTGGSVASLE